MNRTLLALTIAILLFGGVFSVFYHAPKTASIESPIAKVARQSFSVEVKTIGELEAAHSISVASLVRGDSGKIIYLIPDGASVKTGELLIKMDPTPFEEKLVSLRTKLKEQESYAEALKKGLDWEISQAERDDKIADFEIEAAQLECIKVSQGDGPLEISRLKSAMNKALARYEEMDGYSTDLLALQKDGFLNPVELRNAQKKLEEEKETYEAAKLQYDSYLNHVYPLLVKKTEAAFKQAKMKKEETRKIRGHAIAKAGVEINQVYQYLEGLKLQCQEAEKELSLTEICAPAPGMVVHREDFRNSQRRKPRLGDIAVRNQIILELPDLNLMTVKTKVRELDLCKVELGRKATVEIDSYPELLFTGTVDLIGMLALPEPGKPPDEKYFEIRITLDESDPHVRPGMTARVQIHSDKVQDTLTIPVHALFYEQKQTFCYVAINGAIEKREVSVGLSNEEWAEIKEGINEGEFVCLTPPTETLS